MFRVVLVGLLDLLYLQAQAQSLYKMDGFGLNPEDFEVDDDYDEPKNESLGEDVYEAEEEVIATPLSRAEMEERVRAQIAARLSFTCDHCDYATSIGTGLLRDALNMQDDNSGQ